MQKWEKEVRTKCEKVPALKKLLAKHSLALVISRHLVIDEMNFYSYSFVHKTNDRRKSLNETQLTFLGCDDAFVFQWNEAVGQQNLVVDLGKWDFEKDPEPEKISIDNAKVYSTSCKAEVGHGYLEHVLDDQGNNFYVLFQVVDRDDPNSRYLAFIWRKLPAAKPGNK